MSLPIPIPNHDGAVDGGRPGGEGERGGGLNGRGETRGGGRRAGGGPTVMVVPPWDSPARAGKGGGESGTRKPCSSSSSSISSDVARAFPLLISSAFSSSANSIAVSPRVLAFPCVFFLHVFLGTASGTPMGICASSSRRPAAVVSLDNPPIPS